MKKNNYNFDALKSMEKLKQLKYLLIISFLEMFLLSSKWFYSLVSDLIIRLLRFCFVIVLQSFTKIYARLYKLKFFSQIFIEKKRFKSITDFY